MVKKKEMKNSIHVKQRQKIHHHAWEVGLWILFFLQIFSHFKNIYSYFRDGEAKAQSL